MNIKLFCEDCGKKLNFTNKNDVLVVSRCKCEDDDIWESGFDDGYKDGYDNGEEVT